SGTTIGGAAATARNLISGNTKSGVLVRNNITSNSTIANNWIGLNASGGALGNGEQGVLVQLNPPGTTIGPANVIAASGAEGVWLNSGGAVVKGNFIGTNSTGAASDASFTTGQPSVRIDAGTGNRVGGTTAADRNVIALSKALVGIDIGGTATGSQIFGNYIGVNAAGSASLNASPAIGSAGIRIGPGSNNNQIGSATAGSGNIIGGAYAGIKIESSATGTSVKNNSIGVGAGGQNVGNSYYGVWLLGSTGNTIGGALGAEGNVVAYSGLYGIYADGAGSSNNTIAGNTIRNTGLDGVRVRIATGVKITQTQTSANAGNGIALAVGGNVSLAAPSTLQFSTPGGVPTLNGTTCAGCVVEVFTSATSDDGEGPRYLTTTTASGTIFTVAVTGCSRFLTATARDASNNTSSFSTPMLDAGAACVGAQPNVQLDAANPAAKTVAPGASATYAHTLRNTGSAQGTFQITTSSTQPNWSRQLSSSSVALAPGASTTITLTVTPPANTAAGTSAQTTITATAGNLSASQTDTTTVATTPGVQIGPPRTGKVTAPGTVDYTHLITNTGNVSATIDLTEGHTNANVTVSFPDGATCAIAAGASCTRRVRVTANANATGQDVTTVTATVRDTTTTATVQDTTVVVSAAIPAITPGGQQNVAPGATTTFTHTVTNVGNITGSFTVTLQNAAPAGWTFLYTPTTQFTLAPDATRTITVSIGAASGASAPAAGSSATAQVQVESSDGATTTASDTATALLAAAFSFGPASQPTVGNLQPGQTAVFTHTLTNLGNGDDTFTVTASLPPGWTADTIAPIKLARGASQNVAVRVHVASGAPAGSYPIQVSARTNNLPQAPSQTQTDTAIVVGAAVPQLSAGQTQNALSSPTILTFTHSLQNTGNQTGTFQLAASLPGAPVGWSVGVSPSSCAALGIAATCAITVEVSVPAGVSAGSQNVLLTASTNGPPASSTSVTDVVVVPVLPSLTFAPSSSNGSGDPGTVVTYTHTLTNTGNSTDSYTLTVSADPGWTAEVSPTLLGNVPRGAARTVQVYVLVPGGISAGSTGTVTTTAVSAHAPFPSASVADHTTVSAKAAATLLPATQSLVANPTNTASDTVTFMHVLRNTGSVSATFTLSKSDSQAWTSILTPTEVGPLLPGETAMVTLTVTAPAGSGTNKPSNVTTISVFDKDNPGAALATASDTTAVGTQAGVLLTPTLYERSAIPGATLNYVHTLKNTGATTDTFILSTMSPIGWNTSVAPTSVDLPANGSTTITVTVRVPTSALSGTLDITTLQAQSLTDSGAFDTAEEHTTVLHITGLDLSPSRFLPVKPGSVMTFQHALVNTGNGLDTFTLSATFFSSNGAKWPVTVEPATLTVQPGASYQSIQVRVTVPEGVQANLLTNIQVTATSKSNPAVKDTVIDTIGSIGQAGPNQYLVFFPFAAMEEPLPTNTP
ncbi:MAG TPA: NEW3 domain-containing protein, partial [Roseiflexaceae bacterium]|nr:NEW3 domain-containing protein [Roseiflexaceae bacterium]